MKVLLYLFLIFNVSCFAADLPKTGISPPTVLSDFPGGQPVDPSAPIGSGLLVIGLLSILYVLKKKKES